MCIRDREITARLEQGVQAIFDSDRYKEFLTAMSKFHDYSLNNTIPVSYTHLIDEFHLLLKEEQTAAYSVEIWKRFRKWGGIPTGITQNVKDLLTSREVSNVFENSDFVYMLNQAQGDREILDVYKRQICGRSRPATSVHKGYCPAQIFLFCPCGWRGQ